MNWCAIECLISVAHVLVRHRILIFVAKILWRTTHAPQNMNTGAPQMRFSLLVLIAMLKPVTDLIAIPMFGCVHHVNT
jgi:hypothetical protein